eukprot:8795545-Pyramimonas_sp.AAC.1
MHARGLAAHMDALVEQTATMDKCSPWHYLTTWHALRRGNEGEKGFIFNRIQLTLTHIHSLTFGFSRLRRACRTRGRAIIVKRS